MKLEEYKNKAKAVNQLTVELIELAHDIMADDTIDIKERIKILKKHGKDERWIYHPTRPALNEYFEHITDDREKYTTVDYVEEVDECYFELLENAFFDKDWKNTWHYDYDVEALEKCKIKLPKKRSYKLTKETFDRYKTMVYKTLLKEGVKSYIIDW